jgi:hypothetical protein
LDADSVWGRTHVLAIGNRRDHLPTPDCWCGPTWCEPDETFPDGVYYHGDSGGRTYDPRSNSANDAR